MADHEQEAYDRAKKVTRNKHTVWAGAGLTAFTAAMISIPEAVGGEQTPRSRIVEHAAKTVHPAKHLGRHAVAATQNSGKGQIKTLQALPHVRGEWVPPMEILEWVAPAALVIGGLIAYPYIRNRIAKYGKKRDAQEREAYIAGVKRRLSASGPVPEIEAGVTDPSEYLFTVGDIEGVKKEINKETKKESDPPTRQPRTPSNVPPLPPHQTYPTNHTYVYFNGHTVPLLGTNRNAPQSQNAARQNGVGLAA
jgi:hypothetical protein